MRSSSPPISAPRLPLELFIPIIDHLVEPPNQFYLPDLQQFALVCKYFAVLCRVHIFTFVEASFHAHSRKSLIRLIDLVDRHPSILSYIRTLTLDFWGFTGCDMSIVDLERCAVMFNNISDLRDLTILMDVDGEYDDDDEDVVPLPPTLEGLRHQVIDTYVSSPNSTLRELWLNNTEPLPFSSIMSCRGLRDLKLEGTSILFAPEHLTSTLALRRFRYYDQTATFPVHILRYLPFLEDLGLDVEYLTYGGPDSLDSDHRSLVPSFGLCALTIMLSRFELSATESMHLFVAFFRAQAQTANCSPFGALRNLCVDVSNPSDMVATYELLGLTPALKKFTFSASSDAPIPFRPDDCMQDTLRNLHKLSLTFRDTTLPFSSFSPPLSDVVLLFASISRKNSLSSIELQLKGILPADNAFPDQLPWSDLDGILASREGFPALVSVGVDLGLLLAPGSVEEESSEYYELQNAFSPFLKNTMQKLGSRSSRRFNFHAAVWIGLELDSL